MDRKLVFFWQLLWSSYWLFYRPNNKLFVTLTDSYMNRWLTVWVTPTTADDIYSPTHCNTYLATNGWHKSNWIANKAFFLNSVNTYVRCQWCPLGGLWRGWHLPTALSKSPEKRRIYFKLSYELFIRSSVEELELRVRYWKPIWRPISWLSVRPFNRDFFLLLKYSSTQLKIKNWGKL